MKKKMISVISLALVLVMALSACGSTTGGQKAKDLNAYTASYEDVVALLQAEGAISKDAQGVDINATPGYYFDNTTGAPSTEAIALADAANDYDGVYLVKFDIDGDHLANWISVRQNMGALLYMGGMAMLQLDSVKGMFGLGFSADASEDVKTKAKAAFDKLDGTVPEDVKYLTSADELAVMLKNKGYLQATDLVGENLNEKYYVEGPGEEWDDAAGDYVPVDNYKYYAEFASEAKTYGGITVFYFDLLNDFIFGEESIDSYGAGLAYKSLLANSAVTGYVADMDWNYTPYTENGAQVSIPVDVVVGRYAVAIDESVADKGAIIDWLKTLEK